MWFRITKVNVCWLKCWVGRNNMANHFDCKCPERSKPVRDRAWVITEYRWTSGAFSPKGGEPSDYSQVWCIECGRTGRTKSKYVEEIKHMDHFDAMTEIQRRRDEKQFGYNPGDIIV